MRRADLRFSRRELRDLTGWGDTQLKVHLGRLAELEYLLVHRVKAGQGYEYELLYDGEGDTGTRFVMGLSDPGLRDYDARRSASETARSGVGRPVVGVQSGGGRTPETGAAPQDSGDIGTDAAMLVGTHARRLNGSGPSYPRAATA